MIHQMRLSVVVVMLGTFPIVASAWKGSLRESRQTPMEELPDAVQGAPAFAAATGLLPTQQSFRDQAGAMASTGERGNRALVIAF